MNALATRQKRASRIFALFTVACAVFHSAPSGACRMVLPGAASKSNEANFAYFDQVAVLQAISVDRSEVMQNGLAARNYVKLRLINSYKGNLPREFYVDQSSGAACGQDLRLGVKFLAFFDGVQVAPKLTADPSIPLLYTTLMDFTQSHKIDVADLAAADEIIQKAKRR